MLVDNDKKKFYRSLGVLSSIGLSVVLAIIIGILIGRWLDGLFGTTPLFFFIFLFIGIVAGFRNIFVIVSREVRKDDTGEDKRK